VLFTSVDAVPGRDPARERCGHPRGSCPELVQAKRTNGWVYTATVIDLHPERRPTLFEVELTLEDVVDRLDDLPQWLEEPGAGPFGFALTGRAQQVQPGVSEFGLELTAVVVLVRDHDLPNPVGARNCEHSS
jgi:hypothetical protein